MDLPQLLLNDLRGQLIRQVRLPATAHLLLHVFLISALSLPPITLVVTAYVCFFFPSLIFFFFLPIILVVAGTCSPILAGGDDYLCVDRACPVWSQCQGTCPGCCDIYVPYVPGFLIQFFTSFTIPRHSLPSLSNLFSHRSTNKVAGPSSRPAAMPPLPSLAAFLTL